MIFVLCWKSPYPCLLTIFFVKCLIVAVLPVTPTNGTDAKAARLEWLPHPLAQYYVMIITGLDDVIFDDLIYVGEQSSLEIHYNTLVTKKAEKKPEKIEVCLVVSAIGNGTVIARTTTTCLGKFNKRYICHEIYSSWYMYDRARFSMEPGFKTKELIQV